MDLKGIWVVVRVNGYEFSKVEDLRAEEVACEVRFRTS